MNIGFNNTGGINSSYSPSTEKKQPPAEKVADNISAFGLSKKSVQEAEKVVNFIGKANKDICSTLLSEENLKQEIDKIHSKVISYQGIITCLEHQYEEAKNHFNAPTEITPYSNNQDNQNGSPESKEIKNPGAVYYKLAAASIIENVLNRMLFGNKVTPDPFHNSPNLHIFFPGLPTGIDREKFEHVLEALPQSDGDFDFIITEPEREVLKIYDLYKFYSTCSTKDFNKINTTHLNNYFSYLKSNETLPTVEKHVVSFLFLQSLADFHKIREQATRMILFNKSKNTKPSRINGQKEKAYYEEFAKSSDLLHCIARKVVDTNMYRYCSLEAIINITNDYINTLRSSSRDEARFRELILSLCNAAKNEYEVISANISTDIFLRHQGDVDSYEKCISNTANLTLMRLISLTWNNLGFSDWPYYRKMNPDEAIDYLLFIKNNFINKDNFEGIEAYKSNYLKNMHELHNTGNKKRGRLLQETAEESALFFYFTKDTKAFHSALKHAKINIASFYIALSMIAINQFDAAIQSLEKNKQLSADLRIKALLGALYERKLSKESEISEECRRECLEKAIIHYSACAKKHPELKKNLGRVYEIKKDYQNAYEQWKGYQTFLETYTGSQKIRAIRFRNEFESRLVQEKVNELSKAKEDASTRDVKSSSVSHAIYIEKPKNREQHKVQKKNITTPATVEGEQKTDQELETLLVRPAADITLNTENDNKENDHAGLSNESWELVNYKKTGVCTYNKRNPNQYNNDEIDKHWEEARSARNTLNNMMLAQNSEYNNYDNIESFIDEKIKKITNHTARLHFIQNREWILRNKSFDISFIYSEVARSKTNFAEVKQKWRSEALLMVENQVNEIIQHAFDYEMDRSWFLNPDLLKGDAFDQKLKNFHPEFRVQFGAQFSTAAHIMQDIYFDFCSISNGARICQSLYGHSYDHFNDLAGKFYAFRDYIDPWHKSKHEALPGTNSFI